jgi:hypothetical protein
LGQQERGAGVAQVVKAVTWQAFLLKDPVKTMGDGVP